MSSKFYFVNSGKHSCIYGHFFMGVYVDVFVEPHPERFYYIRSPQQLVLFPTVKQ